MAMFILFSCWLRDEIHVWDKKWWGEGRQWWDMWRNDLWMETLLTVTLSIIHSELIWLSFSQENKITQKKSDIWMVEKVAG